MTYQPSFGSRNDQSFFVRTTSQSSTVKSNRFSTINTRRSAKLDANQTASRVPSEAFARTMIAKGIMSTSSSKLDQNTNNNPVKRKDEVKEMSHHQLNKSKGQTNQKQRIMRQHHVTPKLQRISSDQQRINGFGKSLKEYLRISTAIINLARIVAIKTSRQIATRGFESQGLSMKLKLRRKAQRNRRATTVVQKKVASAHSPEGSRRSPGSPTSCQDKLKQTRRYQTIRHQQNTQTRVVRR
ncbi:unnamed protein product [Caenorhabditis brenneri]